MSRVTLILHLGTVLSLLGGSARAEMPVLEALQKEQQAERSFYKNLRKAGSVTPASIKAARASTVGPARAQVGSAVASAIDRKLARYGLYRGNLKDKDLPMKQDVDLTDAIVEKGFDSVLSKIKKAGSTPGSIGASAAVASRGAGQASPAASISAPAVPEVVLDGSDIPRYLQFKGKASGPSKKK